MYKNHEGYPSPTEGEAIHKADIPPRELAQVMHIFKLIAGLIGYEIVGRVIFKNKYNGREWR